jgi:hypothetical protein
MKSISSSKKKSKKFLISLGTHDRDGKLTENYNQIPDKNHIKP